MPNIILVDDRFVQRDEGCTESNCTPCTNYPCKTYVTLIDALKKGLSIADTDDIYTIAKWNTLSSEKKNDKKKSLRFVCLHASCFQSINIFRDAIERSIPIILIRDEDIDKYAWIGACQSAGWEGIEPAFDIGSKLFYMIHESDDVRGAVKWIINYYTTFKKKILSTHHNALVIEKDPKDTESVAGYMRNSLS